MNESSVRFRLRRSEVERLVEHGAIESAVGFPAQRALRMRLAATEVASPRVTFDGESIEIQVPRAVLARWGTGKEPGIYGVQDGFEIVVEKDFRRTAVASDDDDDRYPNPRSRDA